MTARTDQIGGSTLLTTLAARTDFDLPLRVAAVLFVTALTAAAAQISFPLPFTPVPFTLQPMVVLIGGAALGARLGMSSQILWMIARPASAASDLTRMSQITVTIVVSRLNHGLK